MNRASSRLNERSETKDAIVEGMITTRTGLAFALGFAILVQGCAALDETPAPQSPAAAIGAHERAVVCVTAPNVEEQGVFWAAREATELVPSAPRIRQSISLGYVGDEPLSGGVTRYDDLRPRMAVSPYVEQRWEGYITTPNWRSTPALHAAR
jgi:hypothetical protein